MTGSWIVGNWKMNGTAADLGEARAIAAALAERPVVAARIGLCPPATLLARMADVLSGSAVAVGGQDCHTEEAGAFTGEISARMLMDAGARLVIVGHSERRAACHESDAVVAAKAIAAVRAGLEVIICVGESRTQRDAGRTLEVLRYQVEGSIAQDLRNAAFAVAYEPIWAIGTGSTPTTSEIQEAHALIRDSLGQHLGEIGKTAPILYGGSVKPDNASEILRTPEVGGALVGGGSLNAASFLAILRAA
jgi:triosephosphate isomerase